MHKVFNLVIVFTLTLLGCVGPQEKAGVDGWAIPEVPPVTPPTWSDDGTVEAVGAAGVSRTVHKSRFEAGDRPTESDFIDIFDSFAHQSETNTFSGVNTFTAANVFSGANTFSGNNTISGTNAVSGPINSSSTINVQDLVITNSITVPSGAAPATAVGNLAFDNNVYGASRGALETDDGTEDVVLLHVLESDTPSNGEVPKFNTGGTITWETDSGGAFSDASDPIAQNTITKDFHVGDGAGTLTGKMEIGGDADQPQLVIEGFSTQTDDILIIQNDADTEVFSVGNTGAMTLADGVKQTFNPDATNAGINVGSHTADPSTPANGDLWYDSTANELTARINGANTALGASPMPGSSLDTELLFNSSGNIDGSVLTTDGTDITLGSGDFNVGADASGLSFGASDDVWFYRDSAGALTLQHGTPASASELRVLGSSAGGATPATWSGVMITSDGTNGFIDHEDESGSTGYLSLGNPSAGRILVDFSGGVYLDTSSSSGVWLLGSVFRPNDTNVQDLGASGNTWKSLYIGTSVRRGTTAGITASVTQTQGNGALTTEVNEVSVVANVNDTVTLPTAAVGWELRIINNGANTLQIFPASGDNLGAGVDTATTLASGSNVIFVAFDATNWEQF